MLPRSIIQMRLPLY